MTLDLPNPRLVVAVEAALDKKAEAAVVLDLRELGAFTDYFLICHGWSTPQMYAVADEIEKRLDEAGACQARREGSRAAEWILLDYGDFVAHIFNEKSRLYYDLERLWRAARRVDIPQPGAGRAALGR